MHVQVLASFRAFGRFLVNGVFSASSRAMMTLVFQMGNGADINVGVEMRNMGK